MTPGTRSFRRGNKVREETGGRERGMGKGLQRGEEKGKWREG